MDLNFCCVRVCGDLSEEACALILSQKINNNARGRGAGGAAHMCIYKVRSSLLCNDTTDVGVYPKQVCELKSPRTRPNLDSQRNGDRTKQRKSAGFGML